MKNSVPVKTAVCPRFKALPMIVDSSTGRSLIPCCSNNLIVSFSGKQKKKKLTNRIQITSFYHFQNLRHGRDIFSLIFNDFWKINS